MEELFEFVFEDLGSVFWPTDSTLPFELEVDDILAPQEPFIPTDPSILVDLVLTGVTDALAGEMIA